MVPPAKIQPKKRRNSLMTDNPPVPASGPKIPLFYVETEAVAALLYPQFWRCRPLPATRVAKYVSIALAIEAAVRFRQASEVNDLRSPRFDT